MSLQDFQRRMSTALVKSTSPDDFSAIRKETDPSGADVVDHTADLKAHPPAMGLKVEAYRKAVGHGSPLMRVTPKALDGVSAKVVYKVHSANNLPNGKMVLVKPYHEKLHPKAKYWQAHPINGWAEMTNQALYHAAGMGDSHQEVHVSEHDMGPGFDKHPAIVVHMDPQADYVEHLHPMDFDPKMGVEAAKIGVMDFLSNNLDRHRHNLLVRTDGATNSSGMPFSAKLLAIDHGRSFQYHASHKGIPSHVDDFFLGPMTVPEDMRAAKNAEGKTLDNLLPYMQSDALKSVSEAAQGSGNKAIHDATHFLRIIEQWWPDVRDRVISTFGDRLNSIKEPKMKQHLLENFQARVEKLDDIAARADWYKSNARIHDLDVPLKVWDR
jgi:Phosphatidylinositol 3- and 4-kinase